MNKWSFDFLPPTIWSCNFCLTPVISSLERVKMFWWEREGCRVRRGEEGNKKNERGIEKEERSCWTSDAAKKIIKGEDFWAAKQIRDVDNWGGLRVVLGKKNITPTFSNFLAFTLTYIYIYIYSLHSHLPTQNSITLHTHIYILTFIRLHPSP